MYNKLILFSKTGTYKIKIKNTVIGLKNGSVARKNERSIKIVTPNLSPSKAFNKVWHSL